MATNSFLGSLFYYKTLWNIPSDIYKLLQYYTGEIAPYKSDTRDKRRMFFDEFEKEKQENILQWFNNRSALIIFDIIKGRGQFVRKWVLVAQVLENGTRWVLHNINIVVQYYIGKAYITDRGSLRIGKVLMQRKGGDSGRDTANMLQFKVDPIELFDITT